eukprot:7420599-Pyramimonas_sp.AAC.1
MEHQPKSELQQCLRMPGQFRIAGRRRGVSAFLRCQAPWDVSATTGNPFPAETSLCYMMRRIYSRKSDSAHNLKLFRREKCDAAFRGEDCLRLPSHSGVDMPSMFSGQGQIGAGAAYQTCASHNAKPVIIEIPRNVGAISPNITQTKGWL